MPPKRNLRQEKKIAKERIEKLFSQADEVYPDKLAHRYVELARKIGMKYRVRIKPEFQRKFCKHCYKYLRPGVNCRVRTRDSKVVYTCFECNNFMRFPMLKEKSLNK